MTNDTTAIILDPSVDGTEHTSNETEKTWTVTFPNYTTSGIASCNSTSGANNTAYPGYNNRFTQETSGVDCWSRMTNPVRSAWVFRYTHSSASDCATTCAERCGYRVRDNTEFRTAIIGSAGQ